VPTLSPTSCFLRALTSTFVVIALTAAPYVLAASSAAAASSEAELPIDYLKLDHTVVIDHLRAGNHDASGTEDYYFKATLYGLLNTTGERGAPLDKRKKIEVDLGTFGDTKIEALRHWSPDKEQKQLQVKGDQIRALAARTMTELAAAESAVAVMVEVALFEREKKLGFFGDDLRVGAASYFPVPESQFDGPARADVALNITDDKGTSVQLSVHYDHDAAKDQKKGAPAGAAPGPASAQGAPAAGATATK
jgi:hypothetical protein